MRFRTIDIDIVLFGNIVVDSPNLRIPHPAMHQRRFVLEPLAEIAPNRVIGGIRVRAALDRVDTSGIEKLPPRNEAKASEIQ